MSLRVGILVVTAMVANSPCLAKDPVTPHFVDQSGSPRMMPEILRNIDEHSGFDHGFRVSYVTCGTGCGSYWFVNRRTGEVIAAPDPSTGPEEIVWDLLTSVGSNIVTVIYGRSDAVGVHCRARMYRLVAAKFMPVGEAQSLECPN